LLPDVIDASLRGEGIEPAEEEPNRSNVVDLMSALRQSLGQRSGKALSGQTATTPASARLRLRSLRRQQRR
jgi:DNA end-binding protein Ku